MLTYQTNGSIPDQGYIARTGRVVDACLYRDAMIRLLLSLLALLSGVVVSGAPAQALVCGAHETELNAPAQAVAHVAARPAALAAVQSSPAVFAIDPVQRLPAPIDVRPSVLIGIDRARE